MEHQIDDASDPSSTLGGCRRRHSPIGARLLHRGGPAYGALDVNRTDDPAPNGCTPEPGGCSLREAIIAANAVPSTPDTINLPGGFYQLSRGGINENPASTGDLDITSTES